MGLADLDWLCGSVGRSGMVGGSGWGGGLPGLLGWLVWLGMSAWLVGLAGHVCLGGWLSGWVRLGTYRKRNVMSS